MDNMTTVPSTTPNPDKLGNVSGGRWKTRDGLSMLISEMTDSHLRNAIRMLETSIAAYPGRQFYIGDSEHAEQAVELENQANIQQLARVTRKLRQLQAELKHREALPNPTSPGDTTAPLPSKDESA